MKIVAITSAVLTSKDGTQFSVVYGLSDDENNTIYRWNYKVGEWFIDAPVKRTIPTR